MTADAAADVLLAVAALTGLWALDCLRRIAAVGCAYKAKVLASALFVSRLDLDPDEAPEVSAEAYSIMRLFKAKVDRDAKRVTVSAFGLLSRSARWRPGLGAALEARPLPPAAERHEPAKPGELPVRGVDALLPVVAAAFGEPDPKKLRRTRAIVVLRDGVIVAEGYAPGVSMTTPLNGWSMTKSVMSALVGTLVADGKLSLEDKSLLPQWRTPGDPRAGISVEDLLRMRSGLRFAEVYSDPLSDVTRMLFAEPDAGGFAASRPLESPPGAKWQYASGTSNILSLLARKAVGEADYQAWPRRVLFDPAGMSSAVMETDASGTFVASSFLYATARDWARFGKLFLDDGVAAGRRVLPPGWARFCATPTPQSDEGRYGAHWWLKLSKEMGGGTPAAARIPEDAFHALGHEGQCVTVIPSRGLVVVRLGLAIDVSAWDHAAFLAAVLDALPA